MKERIRDVMNYKKPALGWMIAMLLLFGSMAVCFLTNPMTVYALSDGTMQSGGVIVTDDSIYGLGFSSFVSVDQTETTYRFLYRIDSSVSYQGYKEQEEQICWKEGCQHDNADCMAFYSQNAILAGIEDQDIYVLDSDFNTSSFSLWKVNPNEKVKEEIYTNILTEVLGVKKAHYLSVISAMTDGRELYLQTKNTHAKEDKNSLINIDMNTGEISTLIQTEENLNVLGMVDNKIVYALMDNQLVELLKKQTLYLLHPETNEVEELISDVAAYELADHTIFYEKEEEDGLTLQSFTMESRENKRLCSLANWVVFGTGQRFPFYDVHEDELLIMGETEKEPIYFLNIETGEKRVIHEFGIRSYGYYDWIEYHEEKENYNENIAAWKSFGFQTLIVGSTQEKHDYGMTSFYTPESELVLIGLTMDQERSMEDFIIRCDENKTKVQVGEIYFDEEKNKTQIVLAFQIKTGEQDSIQILSAKNGTILKEFNLIWVEE